MDDFRPSYVNTIIDGMLTTVWVTSLNIRGVKIFDLFMEMDYCEIQEPRYNSLSVGIKGNVSLYRPGQTANQPIKYDAQNPICQETTKQLIQIM